MFSLAAAAARSGRTGDAIRLYELGLTFAPANSDALLALGGLYRDKNDYDAARRQYELAERNGGPAAETARQQLAALPGQQQPPPIQATPAAPAATQAPPAHTASDRPFDGLYAGTSQVLGYSSPTCAAGKVRLEVRNARLLLGGDRQIAVTSDGNFDGTRPINLPPVVQFWTGKIAGDSLEVDIKDPACRYHLSLKRVPQ